MTPLRPLWYIAAGKVLPGTKGVPADARWVCREGDETWTPIEPARTATPAPAPERSATR